MQTFQSGHHRHANGWQQRPQNDYRGRVSRLRDPFTVLAVDHEWRMHVPPPRVVGFQHPKEPRAPVYAGLLPGIAWAQGSYPSKPVKFIVPYAAGGQPDVVARVLTPRLTERLGQPVVVENRPGASGAAAYNGLLQSTPTDGHAFILSDGAMLSISPHVNKATNYKLGKDLLPVALVGRSSLYLVAHPKTGVNTLQDFVAAVRKKSGEYNYGSSGIGSNHHLTMEALKAALNLDIRHVPYRGSGQSTPALVSGQVDFSIAAMPSIAGFVQNGHRAVKRVTEPMLNFKSFQVAKCVLAGIELMHMIQKGQLMQEGCNEMSFSDQFYAVGRENPSSLMDRHSFLPETRSSAGNATEPSQFERCIRPDSCWDWCHVGDTIPGP